LINAYFQKVFNDVLDGIDPGHFHCVANYCTFELHFLRADLPTFGGVYCTISIYLVRSCDRDTLDDRGKKIRYIRQELGIIMRELTYIWAAGCYKNPRERKFSSREVFSIFGPLSDETDDRGGRGLRDL
jgi:hypothetical protein